LIELKLLKEYTAYAREINTEIATTSVRF
ncbi:hypothetical protein RRG08_063144, partial [Elysia crispata]